MRVLLYVTAPTGTIHLCPERLPVTRTMCGMPVGVSDWELGDETVSHRLATCGNCRRLAHLAPERDPS